MQLIGAKPIDRKIGLAAWYNLVYAPRGFQLAPHHYPIVAGLEDQRIENFLFLGPPGTGKSNLLCSVYPCWELGHDPSLTILSISAGEKLPQNFMLSSMQIIQHDKTWAQMFPDVRPAHDMGWSIQKGLFVRGHHPSDPDSSYFSCGLTSKALTGLHARLHIYDDLHDKENSSSPEGRAGVIQRYYDTLMGRADPRGVRRVAAGRWWAKDDLYQEWIDSGDWVVLQLPATRPGESRLWFDVFVPRLPDGSDLPCVYSETLPKDAIQDQSSRYTKYRAYYAAIDVTKNGFYWPDSPTKRKEYFQVKRRQPTIAAVNYDGNINDASRNIFSEDDFDLFAAPEGIDNGIATPEVFRFVKAHRGEVEQAWDTALGQPQSESKTVSLTGLFVPCKKWHRGEDEALLGPCDFHFDVYLLDANVQDVNFRDLMMMFRTEYAKWQPRMITIEEKQSGVQLLQVFKGTDIPIRGQKVEQGKLERALNPVMDDGLPIAGGAASVQGWAKMGRILLPFGAEWIDKGKDGTKETGFISRVVSYAGGARFNDEFDALVHLVTRAIILSKKGGRLAVPSMDADIDALTRNQWEADSRAQTLKSIAASALPDNNINPFANFCGTCFHFGISDNREWCAMHEKPTNTFSSCGHWDIKRTAA